MAEVNAVAPNSTFSPSQISMYGMAKSLAPGAMDGCCDLAIKVGQMAAKLFQHLSEAYSAVSNVRKFIANVLNAILEKIEDAEITFGPLKFTASNIRSLVAHLKWFGAAGTVFSGVDAVGSLRHYAKVRSQGDPEVAYSAMIPLSLSIGGFTASALSASNLMAKQFLGEGLWWVSPVVLPLAIGLNSLAAVSNVIGAKKSSDLAERLKDLRADDSQLAVKLQEEIEVTHSDRGTFRGSLARGQLGLSADLANLENLWSAKDAYIVRHKKASVKAATSTAVLNRFEELKAMPAGDAKNRAAVDLLRRTQMVADRRFALRVFGTLTKVVSAIGLVSMVVPSMGVFVGSVLLASVSLADISKTIYEKFWMDSFDATTLRSTGDGAAVDVEVR